MIDLRGQGPSRAQQTLPRRRPVAWRLTTVGVASVCCVSLALTSCSDSHQHASPSTPSPTANSTVPTREQVKAQVIKAWKAEHRAFAEAVRQADPTYPGLAETAVDPQLSGIRSFVAAEKKGGYVGRGAEDLDEPTVMSLQPQAHPTSAVVESCLHDHLILVDAQTGKPVHGKPGRVTWDHERTSLKRINGIGWVVTKNDVQQSSSKESACAST
jgi:hypothetical protein